jgi:hypothetical protein
MRDLACSYNGADRKGKHTKTSWKMNGWNTENKDKG